MIDSTNSPHLLGTVSSIAFGGHGIIRHEGCVVFIPFVIPGDEIRYVITERKKSFAKGECLEIIAPSRQRIVPTCPYFGRCGGCQLQHMDYAAQLMYKRQWIQDALERIGHFKDIEVPPVEAAEAQWSYRRKVSFTLKPVTKHFMAGYIAVDQTELMPVDHCPIFNKIEMYPSDPVIADIQKVAARLNNDGQAENGKVTILKQHAASYLLHFHFRHMPSNMKAVLAESLEGNPAWKGVIASAPGKSLQLGRVETELEIEGLSFQLSPAAFVQNHPEQSLKIYHAVCDIVKKVNDGAGSILDFYCGIGISSIFLGRMGFKVTGVELGKEAVHLARKNAAQNGVRNVSFVEARVESVIEGLLAKEKPQVVLLNPPRTGVDKQVIDSLRNNPPPFILYISCMPATLARDLKLLCADNYRLQQVIAYDMFPQTSHVETLVLCARETFDFNP